MNRPGPANARSESPARKVRPASAVGPTEGGRLLLLSQGVGYFPYVLGASIAWGAVVDGLAGMDPRFPVLARAEPGLSDPSARAGRFAFPAAVESTPRFADRWFRSGLTRLDGIEGSGMSKWPFTEEMRVADLRPCAVVAVGTPDTGGAIVCMALRPGEPAIGEARWRNLAAMIPFFETVWQIECRLEVGSEGDLATPLTEREREVARLVGGGLTNAGIASKLGVAEGTVKAHLNRIFKKYRVGTRTELAVLLSNRG